MKGSSTKRRRRLRTRQIPATSHSDIRAAYLLLPHAHYNRGLRSTNRDRFARIARGTPSTADSLKLETPSSTQRGHEPQDVGVGRTRAGQCNLSPVSLARRNKATLSAHPQRSSIHPTALRVFGKRPMSRIIDATFGTMGSLKRARRKTSQPRKARSTTGIAKPAILPSDGQDPAFGSDVLGLKALMCSEQRWE